MNVSSNQIYVALLVKLNFDDQGTKLVNLGAHQTEEQAVCSLLKYMILDKWLTLEDDSVLDEPFVHMDDDTDDILPHLQEHRNAIWPSEDTYDAKQAYHCLREIIHTSRHLDRLCQLFDDSYYKNGWEFIINGCPLP
jgi:hypothetical protein